MVVSFTFANMNMGNYPPPNTALREACLRVQGASDPVAALGAVVRAEDAARAQRSGGRAALAGAELAAQVPDCFPMQDALPSGKNATVTCGDWSGCGFGESGESWDFETCTLLIEQIGTNGESDMFLPRAWSMDWLQRHCATRFGVTPRPTELADAWGFGSQRLAETGASRIVSQSPATYTILAHLKAGESLSESDDRASASSFTVA